MLFRSIAPTHKESREVGVGIKEAHTLLCYFLIFRLTGCNIALQVNNKMKKTLILLPLLLIVSIANGVDLIVDQSALSQYGTDNYLLFDGFGDGPSHSVTGVDEVHLWNGEEEPPDNAPTDWINYTQEALVYMDA